MLESLLYAETDISANTCADYASELRRAIAAVCAATTFEDLAAVSYIQGQAALGAENISEAIERGRWRCEGAQAPAPLAPDMVTHAGRLLDGVRRCDGRHGRRQAPDP